MSTATKLTAEQIENLAKEIREFLLEHGLWQDVDIYFNGKKYTSYDPENGEYYYNDREHLIEVADQPERHFEYVNPEHILSMSFEGPVCEMLYYGILPSVRREFDKIFERYGLYYEFGHHWNFSCYYIRERRRRNEYWRGSIKGKRNQSAVAVKRLDGLRVCCKQR